MTGMTVAVLVVVFVGLVAISMAFFTAFDDEIDPTQLRLKAFLGSRTTHDQTYGCWKCGDAARCDSPTCPMPASKGEGA